MKIHEGVPGDFTAIHWFTDLKKCGVTLQQLINPITKELGLNYKNKDKNMSITFSKEDSKDEKSTFKKVRKFEIDNFQIPKELSAYE